MDGVSVSAKFLLTVSLVAICISIALVLLGNFTEQRKSCAYASSVTLAVVRHGARWGAVVIYFAGMACFFISLFSA